MLTSPNGISPVSPASIAPWRWGVVWLLFSATLINYMDRNALNNSEGYLLAEFVPAIQGGEAVMGGVGVPLQDAATSRLRNQAYGTLQFSFGIAFGLFQVVAGVLIGRFSLRMLYLMAIIVWSTAGILTGFVPAGAIGLLVACRVMLGIGEAFNWPCAVACIGRVIPRESRGLANGIFHSGASIGAVATPLLLLLLVDRTTGEGWRTLFVFVGALGFLWAVAWLLLTRGERATAIDSTAPPMIGTEQPGRTPFKAVLRLRAFWICLATGVCVNLCWHFYVQWFPRYLNEDLGVTGRPQQWVLAGFFIVADLGSMFCGWMTRKLARSGFTVERSRQLVMTGVALTVCAATVTATSLPADLLLAKYAVFYVVAAAAIGGFAIFFSLAQDIVPQHTALILGISGCASWLVISAAAKVAGELAGPGRYAELFIAVSCVPLLAAIIGWGWKRPA